jgi:RHS repeat-associated protein
MKFPNLLIFTLSLLSATALVAQSSQPDPNQTTAINDCLNPGDTTGYLCDDCRCQNSLEHNYNSLILNSILNYYGWANEFKTPSASGCAPCGGGGATNGTLPSLELNRFYHIRGNDVPFLSFGFATGLQKYDVSLRLLNGNDAITYHAFDKAEEDRVARHDASRSLWAENGRRGPGFFAIQLYTFAGVPITTKANRNLAHTATMLQHDGSSTHFQIFWKTNAEAWARPVAFMDRHGNAIEITYTAAHFNTVTNPVLDVAPYFKKHKIRDAYSREATFSYILTSGKNVVNKITFPNGKEINYQYGSLGSIGNPMVKKVIHPDGSESTYSHADLTTSHLTVLTVRDVHADLGSRRKTLYFTRGTGINSSGQTVTAVRNRIRQAANGVGETTYASRIGTTTSDERYVYSGGNMVKKITYLQSNHGMQSGGYVANNLWQNGFHQGNTTTWTAELPLSARTNNSARMPISETDSRNRNSLFTRNTITTEITASLHPDATTDTTTRNTFNQPLVSTDRLGRITTRTYSTLGDLLTEKTATGTADESTRTFLYNTRGQVIEARDALYDENFPALHNTRYEYNANGFLVKKIDAADVAAGTRAETLYTYDTAGRLATTTDPVGRTVTFGYDDQNRLVTTTYADTSTELIQYGTALEAALVKKTTDRNGYETTYQYDAADRVTTTVTASNTSHPSTEICTYLTGTNLKQTCTTNGSKTEYLFDHRNRVIGTKVFPDTATTLTRSTELDELGRTRSTTDAYGRKTYYLYDQNDRVTRTVTETVPGGLITEDGNGDPVPVPAFVAGSSQTAANHNYTLTDKDGNTLQTNPSPNKRTHLVTYTDPRDVFLKDLTRDLSSNAPYLIEDAIHDAEGQTLITTDARGIKTWREYDKQGRNTLTIMAVGTADEIRSKNAYDDNSNLVETKNPRHFAETEDDGNGNQVGIKSIDQYTYTGRNLKKSHTTAAGHPTLSATQSWTYNLDGTNNEHKDFRNNTAKQIWRVCCARLQATVDRDGTSTTIQNTDFKGQVIHSWTGRAAVPAANLNFTNPSDIDTLQETTTRYDGRGRPTHTTVWLVPLGDIGSCCGGSGDEAPIAGLDNSPAANGLTTEYAYDDDLTDGNGIDDTYENQITALEGRGVTFGPTAKGSAVEITNPAGEKTVQIQDAIGRTVMTINPEGHIQTMDYDVVVASNQFTLQHSAFTIPGSLLATRSTDALGNSTTHYTDGAGRTLLTRDPAGNFAGAAYDANSNRVIIRDPNGLGQDCTYDNLNRDITCADLQEQDDFTSRGKNYNAHGAVLITTDAEGETTENIYDVRDRLHTSEDANDLITEYAYDANNNLTTLTDPKNATRSWTYDARNLKVTKSMPDANDTLTYEYDALRRIKVETRQDNSTVTLKYDLAGRMEERIYSDSTTDTFAYDKASRLTSAFKDRHDITVNRAYFPDGTMRSESYVLDNRTYTLERTYDERNLVNTQTFADGKVMNWDHDARGLVTNVSYDGEHVLAQLHDAGYRLTKQTFGNDLVRDITYDRLDNMRGADKVSNNVGPIAELDFGYEYLADKNVHKETQTSGTFEDLSFTAAYDPGNRVTSYNRQDGYPGARETQSWNYDGAGNWNSTVIDGNTQSRTHSDSDQLEVIAGDNLTYDPRGNQLTDNRSNEYTWDLDNRIIEADGSGYSNIEYRYDALGRRIVREQGSSKEVLLWWNNTEQSEHKHQAGQTTIQNDLQANPSERALNTIFARALEGDKLDIQYYHKNYLDHVMAVSDDNGNVLEHYRYTAFGEPEIYSPTGTKLATTDIDNDILWNVRRYEPATNLYLYKYRDYDAVSGRWPSRDPIGEWGGINLYEFVVNSPVSLIDILGLEEQTSAYQTQQLSDFTGHYFHGDGADFDLIENGYLPAIQKVFEKEIGAWRKRAAKDVEDKAAELAKGCKCNSPLEFKFGHISNRGKVQFPNVTLRSAGLGFVLGKTQFFKGCEITVIVHCCSCKYVAYGALKFSIDDDFEDPTDRGEILRKAGEILGQAPGGGNNAFHGSIVHSWLTDAPNMELPGGTAYKIRADWSEQFYKSGKAKDCPCKQTK